MEDEGFRRRKQDTCFEFATIFSPACCMSAVGVNLSFNFLLHYLQTRAEDLEAQVEATTAQLKQLKTKQRKLEARNALLEIGNSDEKAQHIYSLVRYHAFFSQGNQSLLFAMLTANKSTWLLSSSKMSCIHLSTIASNRLKL